MMREGRGLARRIRRRARKDLNIVTRAWRSVRRFAPGRAGLAWVMLAVFASGVGAWFATIPFGWMLALVNFSLWSVVRLQAATNSYYNEEAARWAFFPVSDAKIARHLWFARQRQIVQRSVIVAIWFAWAAVGAAHEARRAVDWTAVAWATIGHEALMAALAALWMTHFSWIRLGWRSNLTLSAGIALTAFGAKSLAAPLAPVVEWLLLIVPTGWAAGGLLASQTHSVVPLVVYVAAVLASLAAFPLAFRKFCAIYSIREVEFHGTQSMRAVGHDEPADALPPRDGERPESISLFELLDPADPPPSDAVASSSLVSWTLKSAIPPPGSNWVERLALHRFTRRELTVASFLSEARLDGWSRVWSQSAQRMVIAMAVITAAPLANRWNWLVFAPVVAMTLAAAPVFGGQWPGINFSGSPLSWSTLPISYREAARVVLRVNRVRLLVWIPWAILGCAAAGWKTQLGAGAGAILGAKVAFLVLVIQPIFFLMRFNEGVNDRSRFFRGAATLVFAIACIVLLIASGFALFQSDWRISLAGAAGLLLGAQVVHFDCWRYERGPIDLGGKPAVGQYWN